ncbi:integrase [Mycobacterium sp. E3298]|nr:site-specific integrase [Mycobacterium sp. E3298]OBG93867.1 integrase [Mycobacterium sp. E3298]
MANVLYEDKWYNEEIKKEYIDSGFGPGTKKILDRTFKISYKMEEELGKDLYSFNREELRRLFYLFLPTTEYASRNNCKYVSKYIEWSIERGYRKGLNPLDSVDKAWQEQFKVASKKYWTDSEINSILNKLVNAQDAAIVSLLWNGVKGSRNAEITNLKRSDVHADKNQLTVTDEDGTTRTVSVDDRCIALCEKALRELYYEKKNGNVSKDIRSETAALVDNQYIIRSAQTHTIRFDEADFTIVHRRLKTIKDDLGEENFTPTNILESAMLFVAKELYQQTGRLDDEEYKVIADKFNITNNQSMQRLRSEFLNLDTVKEVYNLS